MVVRASVHNFENPTGEAANSQGDRAKEGRRSARRYSANSSGERAKSYVTLVASTVLASASIKRGCVTRSGGVKGSDCKARKFWSED